MKTSRYDSQRADGTNKWDDCPWLKVCPSEATRGADGSRPPTSAAIGGRDPGTRAATAGGEFPRTGSRVSANGLDPRDSRTAERPALTIRPSVTDGPPAVVPSTGTSWTGPNGGPWGVRGLGPTTPGIRRDRTWPGQSRKACVSRTGRARRRRARGGQAEGRVRVKVVLSESGGVLGAGNSLSGGSGGGAARCALPGACGWRGARRAALLASVSRHTRI